MFVVYWTCVLPPCAMLLRVFFVVSCRRFGTVYQSNLQLSCVRTALPLEMGDGLSLKMGLIDHPETSVSNYKVTLSNHTREGLESSKSKHAEF